LLGGTQSKGAVIAENAPAGFDYVRLTPSDSAHASRCLRLSNCVSPVSLTGASSPTSVLVYSRLI